jgi:hypothetical protein
VNFLSAIAQLVEGKTMNAGVARGAEGNELALGITDSTVAASKATLLNGVDHAQVGTDLCPALSLKTEETC